MYEYIRTYCRCVPLNGCIQYAYIILVWYHRMYILYVHKGFKGKCNLYLQLGGGCGVEWSDAVTRYACVHTLIWHWCVYKHAFVCTSYVYLVVLYMHTYVHMYLHIHVVFWFAETSCMHTLVTVTDALCSQTRVCIHNGGHCEAETEESTSVTSLSSLHRLQQFLQVRDERPHGHHQVLPQEAPGPTGEQ